MLWKGKKSQQLQYFVSIGSGLNQISLIKEAKCLGLHVIGVDSNVSAPGFYHCDLKIQESIENYDVIYKTLQELLVDGDIHGIMTKSYGTAIITASYLNEKFNIPYLPFEQSKNFIDKRKMKSIFIENSILTPHMIPLSSREKISSSQFPVIIKPNIGHAKLNVRLANDIVELKKIFGSQNKRNDMYLMEKFIPGDEIIAAGIIHNNRYYLVEITDKKTQYPPYFIDIMHVTPSKHSHLAKKVESIGQSVADAFGIARSPLIMEFVIDSNEELFLIEAVPEFGGEFIPDILIPASTGYNIIREAIKSSMQRNFKPPLHQKKSRKAVVVRYVTGSSGTLASCNPEGPNKIKGTIFSRIFKEIGSQINEPVTNHDRIGVVIITADTIDNAIAQSEEAVANFNIRIK